MDERKEMDESQEMRQRGADNRRPLLRFPGLAAANGVGGVLLGQMCHNGVLTEVYADFDGEGHIVGLHSHDVGSC